MSKIPQVKLPKIAPPPAFPQAPKPLPSIQSQIFRSNREAIRADPLGQDAVPQKYPRFMKRAY